MRFIRWGHYFLALHCILFLNIWSHNDRASSNNTIKLMPFIPLYFWCWYHIIMSQYTVRNRRSHEIFEHNNHWTLTMISNLNKYNAFTFEWNGKQFFDKKVCWQELNEQWVWNKSDNFNHHSRTHQSDSVNYKQWFVLWFISIKWRNKFHITDLSFYISDFVKHMYRIKETNDMIYNDTKMTSKKRDFLKILRCKKGQQCSTAGREEDCRS